MVLRQAAWPLGTIFGASPLGSNSQLKIHNEKSKRTNEKGKMKNEKINLSSLLLALSSFNSQFSILNSQLYMILDPTINKEEYAAYHDKLEVIINDPQANGFDDDIIAVCQFLAYYFPVYPPCDNFNNASTCDIVGELSPIISVDDNTVARLMLRLGFKLYLGTVPEWSMIRALYDDGTTFDE